MQRTPEQIRERFPGLLYTIAEKGGAVTDEELQRIGAVESDSMIIRFDELDLLETEFSGQDASKIIFAMRDYVRDGIVPEIEDKAVRIAAKAMIERLTRDKQKYSDRVIEQRLKGKIPKKPMLADASHGKPMQATASRRKHDSECECDSECERECECECDTNIAESTGKPLLAAAMTVPTADQITHYILENNLSVSPTEFLEYYRRRNWQGVTDWKQKVNEWDKRKP